MSNFNDIWQEIEENFDFEKVRKIMITVDWNWTFRDNQFGIPDVDTLKNNAKRLMKEAFDKKTTIGSGGFYAVHDNDGYELSFVLESYCIEK